MNTSADLTFARLGRWLISGLAVAIVIALTTTAAAGITPQQSRFVTPSDFGGDLPAPPTQRLADPVERLAHLEQVLKEPRLAPTPLEDPVPLPALAGVAVLNLNTGVGYGDLETAVAAASTGDHLRVQQDLMVGRFTIDKDLSIEGLTGIETLRATTATGSVGDDRAWILVDSGIQLHVRDLVIDGNGVDIYQAFRHKGFGSFDGVVFTDIQYTPIAYEGFAVAAAGGRVDIRNCAFDRIGRAGVLYAGSGVSGSIVEHNTYVGKGAGDLLEYGLDIGNGASVAIWSNTFTDCLGITAGNGTTSAGVLASGNGTVVLVRENAFLDNAIGTAVGFVGTDTTVASFLFNRFAGNQSGIQNIASTAINAERNWWGCNAGPGQPGCDVTDVDVGAGAVDTDPWLVLTFAAAPDRVGTGCQTALVADVVMDSDGADTSGLGSVLDGTPVAFDGGLLGTASPVLVGTVAGVSRSVFLAGMLTGQSETSATLDNQTLTAWVTLEEVLFCDGFESGDTTAWSLTAP